jgi:hypothetical protein
MHEKIAAEEDLDQADLDQADLDAVEHVRQLQQFHNVQFPLKGKMKHILFGDLFVFDARKYLHAGGPGKNSQLTE